MQLTSGMGDMGDMGDMGIMDEKIRLSHGDGGVDTQRLIRNVFYKYFNDSLSNSMPDSFVFEVKQRKLAYTTDSFVVKPLFFRGGNIGNTIILKCRLYYRRRLQYRKAVSYCKIYE